MNKQTIELIQTRIAILQDIIDRNLAYIKENNEQTDALLRQNAINEAEVKELLIDLN